MKFSIGDRVEGGETQDDFDTGRVVGVEGDKVTVAWDSGVRTTQGGDLLRPESDDAPEMGPEDFARARVRRNLKDI